MSEITDTLKSIAEASANRQAALQDTIEKATAKDTADAAVTTAQATQVQAGNDLASSLASFRAADETEKALIAKLDVESPVPAPVVANANQSGAGSANTEQPSTTENTAGL